MRFYKTIVFCSNPVKGVFRYKDVFQIYPINSSQAPHDDNIKMHPLILEYCVREEKEIDVVKSLAEHQDIISTLASSANLQKFILRALSTFSNYYFFSPRSYLQWFIKVNGSEEEVNSQKSEVGLNHFYYPGMEKENQIIAFSKTDFAEIPAKEHAEPFMHLDIDGKEMVTFSKYIKGAFHNFYILSTEEQNQLYAAITLINNGLEIKDDLRSMSFISFISSIETMVALENKHVPNERCETCGQERYKVVAKFKDYLLKYASDNPKIKKDIDAIYGLRSKIVHAGMLLLGDTDLDLSDSKSTDAQLHIHLQAMQVSRLSLMNWILKRDEENKRKWLKKAVEDIADATKTSVEAAQQAWEAEIKIVMENSGMDWEWSSDYALKKILKN